MTENTTHRTDATPDEGRLRAIGVTLLVASVAVGLAVAVSRGLDVLLTTLEPLPAPILVAHVLDKALVNAGIFGTVALAYVQLRKTRSEHVMRFRRPTRRDIRLAIMGFFFVLTVGAILNQTVAALGIQTGENTLATAAAEDSRLYVVAALTSIVFVAPGEELLFRGVIQGRLRDSFGPVASISIGGAVFAIPHLVAAYAGPGATVSIGIVFGVSLALGVLYEYSGTLFAPIVAHGLYNVAILAIIAAGAG